VVSIDRPLVRQHFRRFYIFFKGPHPFKKKSINIFERLDNFSFVLTESCGLRGQKFNNAVYSLLAV